MPRINDIMQPPPGTYGAPDTTIKSGAYNTFVDDVIADLNYARPVSAGGTGAQTAGAARTNLGVEIGTNVQAYDAGLQSIAGLTTAANRMVYTTAADAYATTALTPFARTLLDDADAAAARATLGANNASNLTTGTVATALLPGDLGSSKEVGAQLSLKAATASNVNLWFDRGDDTHAGIIYYSASDDTFRLRTYAADGATVRSQLVLECASANASFNGAFSAASFAGNGSGLTALDAAQLTGTVPTGRLIGTYNIGISGNAATATSAGNADTLDGQHGAFYQSASNLNAGTVADARLPTIMGSKHFTGNISTDANFTAEGTIRLEQVTGGARFVLGTGVLFVQQLSGAGVTEDTWMRMDRNAGVGLFYDSVVKFETTAAGAAVTGLLDATSHIRSKGNFYVRRDDALDAFRVAFDSSTGAGHILFDTYKLDGSVASRIVIDNDTADFNFNGPITATSFSGSGTGVTGVDASKLAGASKVADVDTANSIVQRTAQGDIWARLLRSTYATSIGTIGYIMTQVELGTDNNYVRPSTPAQVAAVLPNIGWGQTWQDVSASRVGGTTYQNTTGRPIFIVVPLAETSELQVSSNGSTWISMGAGDADQDSGSYTGGILIPVSGYYRTTAGFLAWKELR